MGVVTVLLALGGVPGAAAQRAPVAVVGHLYDLDDGLPIEGAVVTVAGTAARAVTDTLGAFRLAGVPPGAHVLQVRHIAYGTHEHAMEVPGGIDLTLELRLSRQALELEPIDVEVARRPRTQSTRSNVVTRRQIASVEDRARHIGDVVRTFIPGATVTETQGGFFCLEFRGAAGSRTTGCNFPLVVLDGLPVGDAYHFLRDLRVQDLERIEFVPASQGAARYGMGATYGALVIDTRRSGIVAEEPDAAPTRFPAWDWSRESEGHPTWRSIAGAGLGSVVGTGVALLAVGCFPGSSGETAPCVHGVGAAAGVSALALPLVGSVLGARRMGRTGASRGRLLPSLAMAAVPAALGYALYRQGAGSDFAGERRIGSVLVVLGTPLISTLADRLFRARR